MGLRNDDGTHALVFSHGHSACTIVFALCLIFNIVPAIDGCRNNSE